MNVSITTQPYELLIRWKDDGTLAGAHVRWMCHVFDEEGVRLSSQALPPEPVGAADGKGYPLEEIASRVQVDAVIRGDVLEARVMELEQEVTNLRRELAQAREGWVA
jgi:hypothetical protein